MLRLLLPILVCVGFGLAVHALLNHRQAWQAADDRQDAFNHAATLRFLLESELNATAHLANGIDSYVQLRRGVIDEAEIQSILGTIFQRSRHFRNVGIAPGNRLTYIHPRAGNEQALGMYYPENPLQWPAVRRAIEQGKPTLAGPVNLIQGGRALIYRAPLFINGAYWGLISSVIDIDSLFSVIGQTSDQSGYRFALRGLDGMGSEGQVFLGAPELFTGQAVTMTVLIPGGTWQIAVGMRDPPPGHALPERAIGWLAALLAGLLTHLMLRSTARQKALAASRQQALSELEVAQARLLVRGVELEQAVVERTRELSSANRALNQAKEAAEQANRSKSDFIARMSHEMRAPMNTVIGLTQLLARDAPRPEQAVRLDKIQTAAEHLIGILNDTLDFSKVEAGKISLVEEDFTPIDLAGRLHDLFAEPAAARDLVFTIDFSDLPARLHGDPMRLLQMLVNYTGNALQSTLAGSIRVEAGIVADHGDALTVRFSVADTGIGLDGEQLEKIFEPFAQTGSASGPHCGGTGLGLSINCRLAALLGGRTGVDSRPGQGSLFWFSCRLGKTAADTTSTVANKPLQPPRPPSAADHPRNHEVAEGIIPDHV